MELLTPKVEVFKKIENKLNDKSLKKQVTTYKMDESSSYNLQPEWVANNSSDQQTRHRYIITIN